MSDVSTYLEVATPVIHADVILCLGGVGYDDQAGAICLVKPAHHTKEALGHL